MADFQIRVESMWTNDGTFEDLSEEESEQDSEQLTLKGRCSPTHICSLSRDLRIDYCDELQI